MQKWKLIRLKEKKEATLSKCTIQWNLLVWKEGWNLEKKVVYKTKNWPIVVNQHPLVHHPRWMVH
jgi:hypothetical protein